MNSVGDHRGGIQRRTLLLFFTAAILLGPVLAQRQYSERQLLIHDLSTNRQPPDGTEFVFARVRYNTGPRYRYFGGTGWAHDYPVAEEHILQIADEATTINLNNMSYVIVDLESPELFKYPFIYFSEVGEMDMTDSEASNLREYLNRGGFAMVDDFDRQVLLNWFQRQMQKVFPDRPFVEMKIEHPIFSTFYDIKTLDVESANSPRGEIAKFYGYYDDQGRLCMIINHNNDLGDYWEWIDQSVYPLAPSTEALRFGINYILYAMTH